MQQEQTNPLATGSIGKLLFRLAIPSITAQIINVLYNMVDRMFIGHIPEIGAAALTGVGITFPIITLISAFSYLIGMGGAPLAAIEMGKNNQKQAEKIMGNCFSALIMISVLLTVFFLSFQKPLLLFFGASENTLAYAIDYLSIYTCGTVFVQISLGLNTFITSQGFAKTSMLTVLIGAILNIILDPIFIFGFNMGVRGAALATVFSQCISAIWVFCFLRGHTTKLKLKKENLTLQKELILPILALGISPFIMQSTESLLTICLNTSLQKYGGDLAVGAMTINQYHAVFHVAYYGLNTRRTAHYKLQLWRKTKTTCQKNSTNITYFCFLLHFPVMAFNYAFSSIFCKNIYKFSTVDSFYSLGTTHLYECFLSYGITNELSAIFYCSGKSKSIHVFSFAS